MNAVCIIGSPRAHGSTAHLVDSLIDGLTSSGFHIKRYCLGECDIHYCLGCKQCYIAGKCVQKDDTQQIISDILSADLVVIGSPSYWGDITGQLKVFFDRSTPYGDTNENRIPHDKEIKGIAISVRAGKTERENLHILDSIAHYFGHMGIAPIGRLSVREVDTLGDLRTYHQQEITDAYQMGANIVHAAKRCGTD